MSREYPSRPLVGSGAIVHRGEKVLMIRRKFEPNKGKWSLPGGLVELGETAHDAAVREIREETGLRVKVEYLLDVGSDLHRDDRGKVKYHFLLVDFVATPVGGRLKLNHESTGSGWFTSKETKKLRMSAGTRGVLNEFYRLYDEGSKPAARRGANRPAGRTYCFSLLPLSHHSR